MPSKTLQTALVCVATICCGCSEEPPQTACDNNVTEAAKPVEFTIHNAAMTPRFYATKCDSPFRVLSPTFGYAPANIGVLFCNEAPKACNESCTDVGLMPFAPNTSQTFTWDGVVHVSLNATNEGCPAANAGGTCFDTCVRRQDGDAGEYKLKIRVYEEDLTLTEYETTFQYPKQLKVTVDVP